MRRRRAQASRRVRVAGSVRQRPRQIRVTRREPTDRDWSERIVIIQSYSDIQHSGGRGGHNARPDLTDLTVRVRAGGSF